ncbi:hypothetical protein PPTG_00363 [Phytophthora nicotianae INRA-310]|uniref:DUF7769 domain-containing protein n=1 Tax=Phytophthora nicotianae (strain INRA-310) TaxID=761204 RepID=W2RH36_PHYN3|nr:hypothetical protein PPTG_00363 [Phytophthora nicotianae INRA-310]ETN23860.1 hypothetical protein PPTG_00363 [Phytophthora nicotianae INRA-310]
MRNLTDRERRTIIDELLTRLKGGKLVLGALTEVARKFSCDRSSVSRLWTQYQSICTNGISGGEWRSRIKTNSGAKQIDRDKVDQKLSQVPAEQRIVMRRTAVAAALTRYPVSAMLKEGRLHHRSTRIKPALTTENKHMRVEHVLSYIDDATHNFEPMENVIHIDEKWFNQDKNTRTYMLL